MSQESKVSLLKDRAHMLMQARLFFSNRGILEVDTPILSPSAPIDAHIDLIEAQMHDKRTGYFHSSPEYAMKRLISMGLTDIYQIGHVFRYAEEGANHNPEFTMAEWYKARISFEKMISETLEFIQLFLGDLTITQMSFRELFIQYANIDYLFCKEDDLVSYIRLNDPSHPLDIATWDKDTLLQYILSFFIEPRLGENELFVLKYFPASQAALSQVSLMNEEPVAERFEVYYKGIELANGYHELTCAKEQKRRFESSNQQRISLGKKPYPIDQELLLALEKGLADCCGVAVGFDRLMMLRHGKKHIKEAIAFCWAEL